MDARRRYGSIAIISSPSRVAELEDGLRGERIGAARATETAGLSGRVVLVLYVALTRPTQALAVVHSGDLPAALAG
ncbi:MAG: hypothetical protein NVS1B12_10360 [Acidimicrobiales bacterium]